VLAPQTQTRLAAALRLTGDDVAAAELCTAALDAGRRLGLPRVIAEALEQQAYLTDSVDLHHAALEIRAEHGLWLCCLESLEAIGDDVVLAACGRARLEMGLPSSSSPSSSSSSSVTLPSSSSSVTLPSSSLPSLASSSLTLPGAVEYARRARGKRGRPASGWDSLTPTEQSVVRLAIDGLSNPDIAARLYMSRSTVKTHLSHVYAKLGVTNRTELARLATPHFNQMG